jgi:hypothetical protein
MYHGRHNPTQGKPNMPDQCRSSHKPIYLLGLDRVTTDRLVSDGELPALRAYAQRCVRIAGSGKP